ncbi:GAF domain-containing protein [Curvibacter sp. APW13]|uniref:GAF domain-containing protein n=1 Tax=Curvibacter sp. APW13 TaxID=3077236 RepID=UPI0028DFE858|nr:GAF domain-containing protein [Curvibacter sp. APW13]MDT8992396.1 GAF domain-containing protein [Curvibacter sp. APW13]
MNIPVHTLSDIVTKHVMPSALATEALPLLIQELGADNGSLMLLSEGRVVHKVLAARDSFAEVAEHRVQAVLTEGLAGWVVKHRQGALASDTELDERWISIGTSNIASALVVPLMSRGCVVGVLSLHHGQRSYFHEAHLARAAELAHLVAPAFEMALMVESTLASVSALCRESAQPSVVLDWQGQVVAVNAAMQALDIAWERAQMAQTLLPRELQVDSARLCDWEGARPLASLPYAAVAVPFVGAGAWVKLVARS